MMSLVRRYLMKKYLFFLIVLLPSFAFSIPIAMTISNLQLSASLTATPIQISVGYPYSSISFDRNYFGISFLESTPVFNPYFLFKFYSYDGINFCAGLNSQIGILPNALDSSKIREIGRVFANLIVFYKANDFLSEMEYGRFLSSININTAENMLFIAPANYSGALPNMLYLFTSYNFNWFKDDGVIFQAFGDITLEFSDAFIFNDPKVEVGLSILTDTGIL